MQYYGQPTGQPAVIRALYHKVSLPTKYKWATHLKPLQAGRLWCVLTAWCCNPYAVQVYVWVQVACAILAVM